MPLIMHERQGRGIMCVREGRRSPKKEKEGGLGGGGVPQVLSRPLSTAGEISFL